METKKPSEVVRERYCTSMEDYCGNVEGGHVHSKVGKAQRSRTLERL